MVSPLLIFLALVGAYLVALALLHRKGLLGPGKKFEIAFGFVLMWRTEQGKSLIDRASRPRRFWHAFGDAGVALAIVIGALVLLVVLLNLWIWYTRPELVRAAAPSAEYFLVLPGINPLIPVWYGILALVVALVVHEGAHGVLARAHDIKVRSLGLLFVIVPIGAFVEPDEEEMERAPTRAKNRVFAAGIMMNLTVALLCAFLFSGVLWASVQPATEEGLVVANVGEGLPADAGGVEAGMILQSIGSQRVVDFPTFSRILNESAPGQPIRLGLLWQGQSVTREVVPIDKYAYYAANAPSANNASFRGRGYIGTTIQLMEHFHSVRAVSTSPLEAGLPGLLFYLGMPFKGLSPAPQIFENVYVVQGPLAALPTPVFWMLTNAFYWILWLNFMVGSFNALPMPIVDGGQMFRVSVRSILRRRAGVSRDQLVVGRQAEGAPVLVTARDAATQVRLDRADRVAQRVTTAVGLVLVAMVFLPIFGVLLLR